MYENFDLKPSGSPYHTILPIDNTSNHSWNLASQIKQLRSNSWSDSLDDCLPVVLNDQSNRTLLGDSNRQLYDNLKKSYAEMLYRWNLLIKRAKVLKYLSVPCDVERGVEFMTECRICSQAVRAPGCKTCFKPHLICALCRLPVIGSANACLNCGHGGHTEHLSKWFSKHDVCAFGCGCYCLRESALILDT